MSVITISRGPCSGGRMLAQLLARRLGYRTVDRDVIVERAAAYGASQEELRDALEKPPTFLDRFQHKKYVYLALIQAALTEEVRTGKVIYHGTAGHLLLKGGPHVLRVRLIAPMEWRVRLAQERLRFRPDEARAYLWRADHDRKKWTQYLYGVDWADPALYDLVLNLEHMDIQGAGDTVASAVRERCFELTPECRTALDDLALASRVRAEVALNRATSHLELDVTAENGSVLVGGAAPNPNDLFEVLRVARSVPGVKEVRLD